MIRFSDTPEKIDITELLSSPALKEIKPERLSGTEARNFWDELFGSEVLNDVSDLSEDDVWREIFGRDECDFQFDFEIDDSIRAILEKFDLVEWDNLSDGERIEVINQFVSILSDKLELDEDLEVVFFDGSPFSLGAFSPSENRVELNRALMGNSDVLRNVIPHEVRHAYQHQRADAMETWMDILYQINFKNYIAPVQLGDSTFLYFTDYQDQLVEAEARAFSKLFSGGRITSENCN